MYNNCIIYLFISILKLFEPQKYNKKNRKAQFKKKNNFYIYRDSLGWAILVNFLVYVTLPVPLKYTGILLGLGTCATYINTIIGLSKEKDFFWEQVRYFFLL